MEMVCYWEIQESLRRGCIATGGNHWGWVVGICIHGLSGNRAG